MKIKEIWELPLHEQSALHVKGPIPLSQNFLTKLHETNFRKSTEKLANKINKRRCIEKIIRYHTLDFGI